MDDIQIMVMNKFRLDKVGEMRLYQEILSLYNSSPLLTATVLNSAINALIAEGYLELKTLSDTPALYLTQKGYNFLHP